MPQRFPVRIELDGAPGRELRIGQTAAVSMEAGPDPGTNAVARAGR